MVVAELSGALLGMVHCIFHRSTMYLYNTIVEKSGFIVYRKVL